VLVLTTFDLDDYVYEALRAGASGFLLKDAPEDQLVAGLLAARVAERVDVDTTRSAGDGRTNHRAG